LGQAGDLAANGKGSGGGWGGDVQDVYDVLGSDELEVVDQGSVGTKRLRADAGSIGDNVGLLNFGHEGLHGTHEGGFAQRTIDFGGSVLPVFRGHAPESRIGKCCGSVAQVEIGSSIAFAFEREDGVGAGVHTAGDALSEMHAEKRELGIGHGIDQATDEMFFAGNEVVVLATKGDDLDGRLLICHAADAIAVQEFCEGFLLLLLIHSQTRTTFHFAQ